MGSNNNFAGICIRKRRKHGAAAAALRQRNAVNVWSDTRERRRRRRHRCGCRGHCCDHETHLGCPSRLDDRELMSRHRHSRRSSPSAKATTQNHHRLLLTSMIALFPACHGFVPLSTTNGARQFPKRYPHLTTILSVSSSSSASSSFLFMSSTTPQPPTARSRFSIAPSSLKPPTLMTRKRTKKKESVPVVQPENGGDVASASLLTNNKKDDITNNLGYIIALGIILALGFSSEFEDIPSNVVEASIPTSSTDLLAIALGESIGGVIGAFFSIIVNLLLTTSIIGVSNNIGSRPAVLQQQEQNEMDREEEEQQQQSVTNETDMSTSIMPATMTAAVPTKRKTAQLFEQALSDSDFFIANGATLSLLELLGVPAASAKVLSVFIAAIPSQFIKVNQQLKEQQRQEEDELMDELLEIEQQKRLPPWKKWFASLKNNSALPSTSTVLVVPTASPSVTPSLPSLLGTRTVTTPLVVDLDELRPVSLSEDGGQHHFDNDLLSKIDQVAIFAEIARWLEYDVLTTEFSDKTFQLSPLSNGMDGALLGAIAGVSSQLYADIIYGQFGNGPREKQREVRTRPFSKWLSLYVETAVSAASLFGIYELSQKPISRYIQGTLAGGVDGCVGSSDFEACLETFLLDNAPGPSPEAQFRALIVNLNMVVERMQDIAIDTTYDDVETLVRAWSVSFLSWLNHALM